MAQKPLAKGTKKVPKAGKGVKKAGGNRGKLYEKTKKGRMDIAPKKNNAQMLTAEKKLVSKMINSKNEENSTAQATNASDRLNLLRAGKESLEAAKAGGKKKKK